MRKKIIANLERRGYKTISYPTTKYTVMAKDGVDFKYFIGKRGAVRVGTTVSNSRDVSRATHDILRS